MQNLNLTTSPWPDYELLDSGGNRKLERYGKFILIRPETQAIWKPARPELWKQAAAEFAWAGGKGKWQRGKDGNKAVPESWRLSRRDVRFAVRLTSFKHTGIFPEQAENWEWIKDAVGKQGAWVPAPGSESGTGPAGVTERTKPQVLNLFGYTGIASIVAAKAGAQVTHVDASKQSNEWAKENARLSGIADTQAGGGHGSIKFLLDDALKFAEREVRRNATYNGIILDPPAFGRGPKGEVWKIEEQLPRLLGVLSRLLSKKPGAFFLLNGYAAGYSPQSFLQAVESSFDVSRAKGEFGELNLEESRSERTVPQGIYVRFVRTS